MNSMDNNNPAAESSGASVDAVAESDDGGEGEDEPSSSTLHCELEYFREQWRKELTTSPKVNRLPSTGSGESSNDANDGINTMDQAKHLFRQGVCAEQNGCLYEAIHFYKRAMQLVPDIEFQVSDESALKSDCQENESNDFYSKKPNENSCDVEEEDEDGDDDSSDTDEHSNDLTARFNRLIVKNNQICRHEYEQKMAHISMLPREVVLYIFKWVVSSELDFRTLEQLSMVCRGFYLCARDPEIWRLACFQIWGANTGSPNKYGSWRNMFLERPRLRYNGVYISKTTYIRHGENSFQDQFYRPWHLVEYFRYLRFFPDGVVLMLTTPDDPFASISKLRYRHPKHPAVLVGRYRLHGCSVIVILQRGKTAEPSNYYQRYKRHRQNYINESEEQRFHIELDIKSYKKKQNYQLLWTHYAIHTVCRNHSEAVSELPLQQSNFPPFWFSRVKSYTSESENPLT